ncbi:hypothetical protein C0Q70_02739 [Pomacea canaliculata]|uniref:Importin-13 n=1 Tax=Pomacea canaliculata TaxID=400727 RepID=A0A2T7PQR7_POMCA|nr:hypothetical protein C0Q70_02739 [Pomacea canaliculata]
MEFTAANVEQVVRQFYCQGFVQQEIHQWLTSAQFSPAAWVFSWELISPSKTMEVQFFGASCLHVKIARFWAELPPEQYHTLKDQLIEKIAQFAKGPKIVLTRLCIGLSSLILHLTPDHWADPIQSLISLFQQENPNLDSTQRCHLLLEILTVLPEEFFSSTLTQSRRAELRHELSKALPHVMWLLQSLLNSSNLVSKVREQALKSLASWADFGLEPEQAEPLVTLVFQALNKHETFDTAVDTLVKIFSHPDMHRYPNTLQKLLMHVLRLQEMFQKAIVEKDMETVHGLCRVVMSALENNTKLLVKYIQEGGEKREFGLALLNIVILYTFPPGQFPVDENCSDISFTFWYMLQDELFECESGELRDLVPIFQPLYYNLIQVLLVKVQYPEEEEFESWSKDEQEAFRCFRQDIGDTMMYAFNVVREPVLGFFCSTLGQLIEQSKTQAIRWQTVEGIFFMFGSMAECVDLEETVYLPMLMNMVPSINFNNITLLSTALYMIVLQGLSNSKVGTAATIALKDITRESLDHIRPFIPQILSTSQERDAMRLMSCVGQVLSVLPIPDIMNYLDAILVPRLTNMQQLVKQEPSELVQKQLVFQVQLLSWLFSTLDTERDTNEQEGQMQKHHSGPKPVYVVMQQILPTVQELVAKWKTETSVVEAVSEMFKKSLTTLMDDFQPLANNVADMMIQMYESTPHASILDVARQIVLLFGSDASFTQYLNTLLNVVCNKTLQMYPAVLREPDVVEAFMIFLGNLLKKTRRLLVSSGVNLEAILKAGITTMAVAEQCVVKASCFFVIEFLTAGYEEESIKAVVNNNIQFILDRVLRAIGGEAARHIMEIISDVLLACCKYHFAVVNTTIRLLLETEGYPSPRASPQDKQNFIKTVISDKSNKRRMREIVKEFSLLCRGLLGTEYVEVAKQFL